MAVTWCSPGTEGPPEPRSAEGGEDMPTWYGCGRFRLSVSFLQRLRRVVRRAGTWLDRVQASRQGQVDRGDVARPARVGCVVHVHASQRRAVVEGALGIEIVSA